MEKYFRRKLNEINPMRRTLNILRSFQILYKVAVEDLDSLGTVVRICLPSVM
jgi:hypothetical protein